MKMTSILTALVLSMAFAGSAMANEKGAGEAKQNRKQHRAEKLEKKAEHKKKKAEKLEKQAEKMEQKAADLKKADAAPVAPAAPEKK